MSDPILQELLSATDPAEKAAILAESAIRDLPDETALVARRCVILHWFDQASVSALIPHNTDQAPSEIYTQLASLPFVEAVPWGLAYHDLTREGLLNRYAKNQPDVLITGARLAAPVYAANLEDETIAAEGVFCYTIAGESETAVELLDKLLARAGSRQDWQYFASVLELQDEAEALPFVQPLVRAPHHWLARGIARRDQGDLAGAIADYDRAIELDPAYATAYYNRGLARRDQGDLTGAIADYDRTIELDPADTTAYTNRGGAYYELENYEQAIADCDRAIELDPASATAYTNRGIARSDQGDLAGAIADYDRAIELDRASATAYNNRGLARRDQGDLAGAIADYDRAIELDPASAPAYYNRGFARRLRDDFARAVRDIEKARELQPDDLSTLVSLAGAYIEAGETQRGRQLAEEVLSLLPESELYDRACVEALIGNDNAALDLLEKSLEEDPSQRVWAQKDPDWRSLHSHPRYRALVGLPPLEPST